MKPLTLILLIMAGVYEPAGSYPISPRPLRKLITESEYIISGHVLEVVTVKRKKNDYLGETVMARIRVVEVLQGSVQEEIIEVPFEANMICPAPPRYHANTDVLAFLYKEKGKYYTVALSYGVKTLSLMDIAIYKSRIQEMQQILKLTDKDEQFFQTVNWLVKCAEQPATRWEGTFELSPESDFMSYYSREKSAPFKHLLSVEQKQILKKALLSTTDPRYCDFGLVDLVYPGNEMEIRTFLLQGLKNITEQELWLADNYMTRLLYGKDSPEMEKLISNFSEKQFESDNSDALKTIIAEFLVLAER